MAEKKEMFTADDKRQMLALARKTIESALKKQALPDAGSKVPEKLKATGSCFVTLHTSDHDLRGCIGNIGAFEPLADNIVHNAFNSAFRDPRFMPVSSLKELESLEIEISVLTAPEEIKSLDEFIIGEHGIILKKNGNSAVFLPQVAPEQGWDVAETMTHLSLKAGLDPDAWRSGDARFSVFRAIVFSEKDFKA